MLKIAEYRNVLGEDGKSIRREKIDLKELEKFGFLELEDYWYFNPTNYDLTLYIFKNTKQIIIHSGEYRDCEDGKTVEPKLYDLIKADLVEKV